MVAAAIPTVAALREEAREALRRVRAMRGDFFLRSALLVTGPTLDDLLAGVPLDVGLVEGVERWCRERVELVPHDDGARRR